MSDLVSKYFKYPTYDSYQNDYEDFFKPLNSLMPSKIYNEDVSLSKEDSKSIAESISRFYKQQSDPLAYADNSRSNLDRTFDLLLTPGRMVIGGIQGAIDGSGEGTVNPLEGVWNAVKAGNPFGQGFEKGEYSGSGLLETAGWKPTSLAGKVAKGVIGFGLDVGLDPTTYLTGGLSALAKGLGRAGHAITHLEPFLNQISKKYGVEMAGKSIDEVASEVFDKSLVHHTGIDPLNAQALAKKEADEVRENLDIFTNGMTQQTAEGIVRRTSAERGLNLSEEQIVRDAENYVKEYSRVSGSNRKITPVNLSLSNAPFMDTKIITKLTGGLNQKKLVFGADSGEKLANIGEKTFAPQYARLRDSIYGSKIGRMLSPTSPLYTMSKTNPARLYDVLKAGEMMRGLEVAKLSKEEKIRAFVRSMNLTPDEGREVIELMERKDIWSKVTASVKFGETAMAKANRAKIVAELDKLNKEYDDLLEKKKVIDTADYAGDRRIAWEEGALDKLRTEYRDSLIRFDVDSAKSWEYQQKMSKQYEDSIAQSEKEIADLHASKVDFDDAEIMRIDKELAKLKKKEKYYKTPESERKEALLKAKKAREEQLKAENDALMKSITHEQVANKVKQVKSEKTKFQNQMKPLDENSKIINSLKAKNAKIRNDANGQLSDVDRAEINRNNLYIDSLTKANKARLEGVHKRSGRQELADMLSIFLFGKKGHVSTQAFDKDLFDIADWIKEIKHGATPEQIRIEIQKMIERRPGAFNGTDATMYKYIADHLGYEDFQSEIGSVFQKLAKKKVDEGLSHAEMKQYLKLSKVMLQRGEMIRLLKTSDPKDLMRRLSKHADQHLEEQLVGKGIIDDAIKEDRADAINNLFRDKKDIGKRQAVDTVKLSGADKKHILRDLKNIFRGEVDEASKVVHMDKLSDTKFFEKNHKLPLHSRAEIYDDVTNQWIQVTVTKRREIKKKKKDEVKRSVKDENNNPKTVYEEVTKVDKILHTFKDAQGNVYKNIEKENIRVPSTTDVTLKKVNYKKKVSANQEKIFENILNEIEPILKNHFKSDFASLTKAERQQLYKMAKENELARLKGKPIPHGENKLTKAQQQKVATELKSRQVAEVQKTVEKFNEVRVQHGGKVFRGTVIDIDVGKNVSESFKKSLSDWKQKNEPTISKLSKQIRELESYIDGFKHSDKEKLHYFKGERDKLQKELNDLEKTMPKRGEKGAVTYHVELKDGSVVSVPASTIKEVFKTTKMMDGKKLIEIDKLASDHQARKIELEDAMRKALEHNKSIDEQIANKQFAIEYTKSGQAFQKKQHLDNWDAKIHADREDLINKFKQRITDLEDKVKALHDDRIAWKEALEADSLKELDELQERIIKNQQYLADDDALETYLRASFGDNNVDDALKSISKEAYVMFDGDDVYSAKVKKVVEMLRDQLIKIGGKEVDIGRLDEEAFENLMWMYLPREATKEGEAFFRNRKKIEIKNPSVAGKKLGFGAVWSPHGIDRKIHGKTLKEVNEYFSETFPELKGINVFSENVADIFLSRALKHVDLIYDDEYMHTMMNTFGKPLHLGQKVEDGYKAVANWGLLKKFLKDESEKRAQLEISRLKSQGKRIRKGDFEKYLDQHLTQLKKNMGVTDEMLFSKATPMVELDDVLIKSFQTEAPHLISQVNEVIVNKANQARKVQILKDEHRLLQMWDKFTHFMKLNMTTVMPSFHLRNAYSNAFLNWLAVGNDAVNPKLQRLAFKAVHHKGSHEALKDEILTVVNKDGSTKNIYLNELYMEARSHGVVDEGFFAKDLGAEAGSEGLLGKLEFGKNKKKIKAKYDPTDTANFILYRKGAEVGQYVENTGRFVHYMSMIRRGYTPQEAADSVRKYLFDYSDLTPFEVNVMKRIIPFYTWLRKSSRLQASQVIDQPGKYRDVAKVMQGIEGMNNQDEKNNDGFKSEFIKDWVQTPFSSTNKNGQKEPIYWNPNLPYNDISRIPNPFDPVGSIKQLFSQSNPLIKVPVEQALNKNVFFNNQIVDTEGQDKDSVGSGIAKRLDHVMSNSAIYNATIGLAGKDPLDKGLNIANSLTGIKAIGYDYESQKNKMIKEKIAQMEKAETMGEFAIKLADVREKIKGESYELNVEKYKQMAREDLAKANEAVGQTPNFMFASNLQYNTTARTPAQMLSKDYSAPTDAQLMAREVMKKNTNFDWSVVKTNAKLKEGLVTGKILSVSDGDTVKVDLGDGKSTEVRFLLIDTPETVDPRKPVMPYGIEASAYTKEILKKGSNVTLQYDKKIEDKYGRVTAWVHVGNVDVNEKLLEHGLAEMRYIDLAKDNQSRFESYRRVQAKAKAEKQGVWSLDGYANTKDRDYNMRMFTDEQLNLLKQKQKEYSKKQ